MHCWNPKSLKAIGDALGKYIDMASPKDQYACARICVEVDLEAGLPEAINLTVGNWSHIQKLDYEQLPFKCRGCHEYVHFIRNCPKTPDQQEKGDGWHRVNRSRAKNQNGGGPKRGEGNGPSGKSQEPPRSTEPVEAREEPLETEDRSSPEKSKEPESVHSDQGRDTEEDTAETKAVES